VSRRRAQQQGPGAFTRFARASARASGRPLAFALAAIVVLVWAATGPLFGFSDTWQLVINTGTTVVTFLMVFLIQSTQNSDSTAIQLKLDELIRALSGAKNSRLNMEDLDQEQLDAIRKEYEELARRARQASTSRHVSPNGKQTGRKKRNTRSASARGGR
jgi:low affinity Fe/Cu permease